MLNALRPWPAPGMCHQAGAMNRTPTFYRRTKAVLWLSASHASDRRVVGNEQDGKQNNAIDKV
jgi:hypothetical protein